MNSPNLLHEKASELAEAARTFQTAAGQPGSHAGAAGSLEVLEEALQVLSAAWSQLATDASPGIVERRRSRASEASSWPQRRRALSRGRGSPDRNPARRGSRVRALRSSVSARAIETRSEPWS